MQKTKQYRGKQGERSVALYLQQRGFRILGKNVYTRWGEIDIIAARGNTIHAIEVKTRTSDRFGGAEYALTRQKIQRMKRAIFTIRRDKIPFITGRTQLDFAAVLMTNDTLEISMHWNINDADL